MFLLKLLVTVVSYVAIKYLAYRAYVPNLEGIFASCTYLAITCEVDIAVGCILAYVRKNMYMPICKMAV